jgi:hypothetical protein
MSISEATTEVPDSFGAVSIVIQVKKPGFASGYQHCVDQSLAELIATDFKSTYPVMSLLTDLHNDWTFQWLARYKNKRQVVHRLRFTEKKEALTALASFLKTWDGDLDKFYRTKVRGLDVKLTKPR